MEEARQLERAALMRLLSRERGEAYEECHRALAAGGDFVLWTSGEPAAAAPLARIYARRHRLCRRKGIRTLGHAEAVARLQAVGGEGVYLGTVAGVGAPRWVFMLFLSPDLGSVVACTAVARPS